MSIGFIHFETQKQEANDDSVSKNKLISIDKASNDKC